MLQAISKAVQVAADVDVPFNSVVVDKCCTIRKSDVSTFTLEKCGVYLIHVDAVASATVAEGGILALNLVVDGVTQQQAFTSETTGNNTDVHALSFETLVQVDKNNDRCNYCRKPVRLSVRNTGVDATVESINLVAYKLH